MLNGSCFTVLNSDESKKVLEWAKRYGENRILQGEGEVEQLQKINLILEKNPEIELVAKFEEEELSGDDLMSQEELEDIFNGVESGR